MASWLIEIERQADTGWWRGTARRPDDERFLRDCKPTPASLLACLGDHITCCEIEAVRKGKKQ